MSFKGSKRVHIAPQGYETERIYLAAEEAEADKVVLLVEEEQTERGDECQEEVVEHLEEADIKWDDSECDIFDLYETLWTIGEVIHNHHDAEIMVNISTGSKITAIGGVIACMATGCHPYYVHAEEYEGQTITRGMKKIVDVPAHPIGLPDNQYLEVLKWVQENSGDQGYVTKGDLVEFANDAELPLLSKYNRQQIRNMYEPVNDEIISPLRKHGYLDEQPMGQETQISLTDEGELMLEAFNFLLERRN